MNTDEELVQGELAPHGSRRDICHWHTVRLDDERLPTALDAVKDLYDWNLPDRMSAVVGLSLAGVSGAVRDVVALEEDPVA